MEFKDYYSILGVKPDDDKQAVKKAYLRLARKYHPDVSTERDAEKKFKEVSEAYEVLGDDVKRSEYDQLRRFGRDGESFSPPPGWKGFSGSTGGYDSGFSDFFENIFGDNRRTRRGFDTADSVFSQRGQDIEIELPVFLEDTFKEQTKTIEYRLPGTGKRGRTDDRKKTLKVKIPKGVVDGERIRLKGQGKSGFGDGLAGDLYLRIRLVPHPLFDVEGRNLVLTLPVTPWEAALGASVKVPTLTGQINLTIEPNSQTGKRLRVKGKGLPGRDQPGDLYVILKVVMPESSDTRTQELWRQLARQADFNPRKTLVADHG